TADHRPVYGYDACGSGGGGGLPARRSQAGCASRNDIRVSWRRSAVHEPRLGVVEAGGFCCARCIFGNCERGSGRPYYVYSSLSFRLTKSWTNLVCSATLSSDLH